MTLARTLACFAASSRIEHIAEPVQDEAARALVDWLGCALAGCVEPVVAQTLAACESASWPVQATLPGNGERADPVSVAAAAAAGAAALDFAATHAPTDATLNAPLLGALLALAEARAAAGSALVHAFVIGAEIACRLAQALAGVPTGSTPAAHVPAAVGSVAACGTLLRLDVHQLAQAIEVAARAAVRPCGATRLPASALAAHAAVSTALAAESGRVAAVSGTAPLLEALADPAVQHAALDGLGTAWQLHEIGYKPYPCARALNGAIDACLGVRTRLRPLLRQLAGVELRVPPQVLADHRAPSIEDEAHARRSLTHVAALARIDGAVGPEQFDARRLASARLAQMRAHITPIADPALAPDAAHALIRLTDGRMAEHGVRCARGTRTRPLADTELSDKFRDLAGMVLATAQAERLLALAWNIRALSDVGALVRASIPEEAFEPAQLPGSPLIPR